MRVRCGDLVTVKTLPRDERDAFADVGRVVGIFVDAGTRMYNIEPVRRPLETASLRRDDFRRLGLFRRLVRAYVG